MRKLKVIYLKLLIFKSKLKTTPVAIKMNS